MRCGIIVRCKNKCSLGGQEYIDDMYYIVGIEGLRLVIQPANYDPSYFVEIPQRFLIENFEEAKQTANEKDIIK